MATEVKSLTTIRDPSSKEKLTLEELDPMRRTITSHRETLIRANFTRRSLMESLREIREASHHLSQLKVVLWKEFKDGTMQEMTLNIKEEHQWVSLKEVNITLNSPNTRSKFNNSDY